jgi:hypothetical protein
VRGKEATLDNQDGVFGVLVESNFVVCEEKAVSKHTVRLEVAKHGC